MPISFSGSGSSLIRQLANGVEAVIRSDACKLAMFCYILRCSNVTSTSLQCIAVPISLCGLHLFHVYMSWCVGLMKNLMLSIHEISEMYRPFDMELLIISRRWERE